MKTKDRMYLYLCVCIGIWLGIFLFALSIFRLIKPCVYLLLEDHLIFILCHFIV